jgi:hypothetical protein
MTQPLAIAAPDQSSVSFADIAQLRDGENLRAWARQYGGNQPCPHLVIDGLFPDALLRAVAQDIAFSQIPREKNVYASFEKYKLSDIASMPPRLRGFVCELNSPAFLGFLEGLSGIDGLIPDPYLEGGGVHSIGTGGFLKVHTDFNWHKKLQLHRRLNLLLYLNEGWNEKWGGELEFWDRDLVACRRRIAPLFNRMVVFSTTDFSFHGHPDPLRTPLGVFRRSIALYYYTADRPRGETKFGKSDMTNYRERPGESYSTDRLRRLAHRVLLRSPTLRSAVDFAKGMIRKRG